MSPAKNIPTVDLNDYTSGGAAARSRLVETLGGGLREYGFLNVEGHGIDASLIRGTYDLWRRFFALPDEVKRRYSGIADGSRGYTPFGVEHAKDNPLPDLKNASSPRTTRPDILRSPPAPSSSSACGRSA